jgi:hypothetical protein
MPWLQDKAAASAALLAPTGKSCMRLLLCSTATRLFPGFLPDFDEVRGASEGRPHWVSKQNTGKPHVAPYLQRSSITTGVRLHLWT